MAKKVNSATGEKIRYCRLNCGLSQKQVANALGLDRTTIGSWETSRTEPKLEYIVKLAQIFRIDPTEILPNENNPSVVKDSKADESTLKPIYSLTKQEQQLLVSFRLLDDDEKDEILAKITNIAHKEL